MLDPEIFSGPHPQNKTMPPKMPPVFPKRNVLDPCIRKVSEWMEDQLTDSAMLSLKTCCTTDTTNYLDLEDPGFYGSDPVQVDPIF